MRILVAIASHGRNNDPYLEQLIAEYQSMPHDVHIVVLSNLSKPVPEGVELIVGVPTANPWSLPFAHRPVFARRAQDFDLFIYSEDDTLITQAHVAAFCDVTAKLHDDEIAGFLRSEEGADGSLYYSSIHSQYHWDSASVRTRGGDTFAFFTNEHGACYMLTRAQLARAIASGGFLVEPHEGKYDMLVSAATDAYTQCGFRKLMCVSRLREFTCKHLTNKYVGRTGLREEEVRLQVEALLSIASSPSPPPPPLRVETRLATDRWAKSYYEPPRRDIVALIPPQARRVLSVGCGWGATERLLVERGIEVTAVPLDCVIGHAAKSRGVRLCYDVDSLENETFDAVLIVGMLHLFDDPQAVLRRYRRLLVPGGCITLSYPNFDHAAVTWRSVMGRNPWKQGTSATERGLQLTNRSSVRRWLAAAELRVADEFDVFEDKWARVNGRSFGLLPGLWAEERVVRAVRQA
jgi:2-polyprenyl-3-methyl-5-hydroxy-6-metoxy-1,4-benzoquinol methylase